MRERHPYSGEIHPDVLTRYAAGESEPGERAMVEAWASQSAERREYIVTLQRVWLRARAGASSTELRETDAAWAALRARLGSDESPLTDAGIGAVDTVGSIGGSPPRPARAAARRRSLFVAGDAHHGRLGTLVRGAAAVLLVAAGVGALGHFLPDRIGTPVQSTAQAPMREVVTGVGERARVRLGDGSVIVLAARSRLGIPADFGVHAREVETEGEAYFVVAHDSTLPFIVHTRGARTVDVGTTFVVRAYPEDREVSVVVSEGSVTLGAAASPHSTGALAATLLHPGQRGSLASGARVPTVTTVDAASYTGWIDGRLAFDNAPLPEVIADLGRWHTTRIVLADSSLAHETLTASLAADSFDDALRTLTTVLALRVEYRGDSVLLHRRRGSHL
jgi:ferric-dicitrate binding protein FerR (iron transport regulator)